MDLTQEQIDQLKSLGIKVEDQSIPTDREIPQPPPEAPITPPVPPQPTETPTPPENLPPLPSTPTVDQNEKASLFKGGGERSETEGLNKTSSVFPLLSISGLTLLSFSGLVLLKGNNQNSTPTENRDLPPDVSITPTQVPKSIQHYLLTSQQLFTQAVQQQASANNSSTVDLLNNSILAATEAIKEFPNDYRGYQQRASIYKSLTDSKPELIDQSISDFALAYKLNTTSAEITRSLASLYAKKGDANKTIFYLNQTVTLEPTKAQNFYDLAKIQQQAGLLAQALDTYNKLIPLITDPTQKTAVESEKTTIETIIAQNPDKAGSSTINSLPSEQTDQPIQSDSPTIQASTGSNLIIAASEEDKNISVTNQTDSNSLAGTATLPANQKEITISNNIVSSTSQVYVTITKGGKNQNLQVVSKSDKSFTVGLDSAINETIEFKWWIIN